MTRKQALAASAAVIAGEALLTVVFWRPLFGPGTWGAGGNVIAWVMCGGLTFLWLNLASRERHRQLLEQAERHHRERMAQAREHHEEMRAHVSAAAASQGV